MYRELASKSSVFAGLLARHATGVSVGFRGETEMADGELVSGNYFDVLGVRPAIGRVLTPDDDRVPGAHPVVVLSHGYWTRRFGAQSGILNHPILVNGRPMTVVGVSAYGFRGIQVGQTPDLFVPMNMKAVITPNWDGLEDYNDYWVAILGRLARGTTREQAEAGINVTYRPLLEAQLGLITGWNPEVRQRFLEKKLLLDAGDRGRTILQRDARAPLLILWIMAGLVLLITFSNVAGLLLARGATRSREVAVRLALGASRWRVSRQMLVEGLLCSLGGAVLGLLVTWWVMDALVAAIPEGVGARGLSPQLDLRLLVFSLALALGAGLFFGLAPAWRSTRPDLVPALKEQGGSAGSGVGLWRSRKGLVVAQVALAMLLLVGAGLFAASLRNLRRVDLGLSPERLLAFSIAPELNGYTPARARELFDALREALASRPGIESVSAATIPAFTDSSEGSGVTFEGYRAREGERVQVNNNQVGPGYFRTLGTPLLGGREFDDRDTADGPRVAIINEVVARRYFPAGDAIGRKFAYGSGNVTPGIEIVGVVKDSPHASVREEPRPFIYTPYAQKDDLGQMTFYVRTLREPGTAAAVVRAEARRLDANLPILDLKTVESQIDESLFAERVVTFLSAAFGFLAAALASMGVYGVLAHSVVRRTREIGIRQALGAGAGNLRWLVLRDVLLMTAIGIAAGLPAAYGLSRLAESFLYQVGRGEPLVFAGAAALMISVALAAGYLPARRATRVNPLRALRYE
jgi:predicted permease